MISSLVYTACVACEFAAPFRPQDFLLLASVANVGKAIGLATFVSTSPAFLRSLATRENLADLSAKMQVSDRFRGENIASMRRP
jgi:hypothetical protein